MKSHFKRPFSQAHRIEKRNVNMKRKKTNSMHNNLSYKVPESRSSSSDNIFLFSLCEKRIPVMSIRNI